MKSYFSVCSSKLFWLKETIMHRGLNRQWAKCFPVDSYSRSELELLRDEKLKHVLSHAATTVPYYKNYFARAGVDPSKVTLNDFPLIEKKDIRGHEDEFVSTAKGIREISWSRTSGSTGEPFRFGRSEFTYTYATLWRGLFRFGIRPGDRRVLVKGVDETVHISLTTKIRRWIYGLINRCIVIDAHFLARNDANIIRELNRLVAYRPKYVHGYVSSIYLLALTAEKHNIDLASLKVKAVVTESEKCHTFQRDLIERTFAAPVIENYGCVEFGMIAQPAKDGRLCINEDHVRIETDQDGAIILTNLDECGFPLIRFKNGDRVTIGGVHAELPYRILTSVEGRIAETIHLPQGGVVHGYMVMYPISKHVKYLREYQVYQPDIDHLLIRVVESEPLPHEIEMQITNEMRDIVGDNLKLEIQKVQSIALTKRGKRAFVCSEVQAH